MSIVVNARFLTQKLTGMQRYAYNLCRRMPSVKLISPAPPGSAYAGLNGSSIIVASHFFRSHFWEQLVLPRMVNGDVLWSPASSGPVKVSNQVITIHDVAVLEHPEYYARFYSLWYKAVWPLLVRRVKKIITVSMFSKEQIVRRLRVPENKVEVVYEGVDDQFSPRPQKDVEALLSTFGIKGSYVLAVGAISARKNYRRLLAAWQKIQAEYLDARLVLVGGGNFAFSNMSGLSALPPRTIHLGTVYDESLVRLYAGALAFIYPSLYEGFGLPVLEAMSVGTPVVTSNNTSLPEVVGNAALFVNPLSTDSIAEGIKRIINDERLRRDLRVRGLEHAKKYRWEKAAAAVLHILREE